MVRRPISFSTSFALCTLLGLLAASCSGSEDESGPGTGAADSSTKADGADAKTATDAATGDASADTGAGGAPGMDAAKGSGGAGGAPAADEGGTGGASGLDAGASGDSCGASCTGAGGAPAADGGGTGGSSTGAGGAPAVDGGGTGGTPGLEAGASGGSSGTGGAVGADAGVDAGDGSLLLDASEDSDGARPDAPTQDAEPRDGAVDGGQPTGTNLVLNGDFSAGDDYWGIGWIQTASGGVLAGAYCITITDQGGHAVLGFPNDAHHEVAVPLESGVSYTFSYTGKTDHPLASLEAKVGMVEDPWTDDFSTFADVLADTPTPISHTFVAYGDPGAGIAFVVTSSVANTTTCFDNVSLVRN